MKSSKKIISILSFSLLFITSVIYVYFEVILNISLVNLYSKPIATIFSDPEVREQAKNIELYGRLISGFGLTLFSFAFLYNKLVKLLPANNAILSNVFINMLLKGIVFFTVWISLVLFLRIAVETMISQTSEKTKLDSIRVVMFKELYGSGTIDFSDLSALNEAHKDPQQKKILTALIPSLAYMSPSINQSINDKTDQIGAFFLSARELKKYEKNVYPILENNKKLADKEFDLYVQEIKNHEENQRRLHNKSEFTAFRDLHLESVNALLQKNWETYHSEVNGISQYSLNMSKKLFDLNRRYFSLYVDKKCSRTKYAARCEEAVFKPWRKILNKYGIPLKDNDFWFDTSLFHLTKMLILFVPTVLEEVSCDIAKMKNSKYCGNFKSEFTGLDNKLRVVRSEQLLAKYPFGLELDRTSFLKQSVVQRSGSNYLREKGIMVSSTWTTEEKHSLEKAVRKYFKEQADTIQRRYNRHSIIDLSLNTRAIHNRNDFYQNKKLQLEFRKRLGKYYYNGYLPQHTNAQAFQSWQNTKTQSNLDIVKMLTYKAEYGFKAGGIFYHLGSDAVKFTIIPTVSIALSALGVLLILSKLLLLPICVSNFGKKKSLGVERWKILIPFIALPVVALPLINNHYISRLSSDLLNTDSNSWTDPKVIKSYGFGYVLDAQNGLFNIVGDINTDLFSNIPNDYFDRLKTLENSLFNQLKGYLHFIFPIKEIRASDLNIVLYRKQYDILMAIGFDLEDGMVKGVAIPALMANEELDMLLDAKVFIDAGNYRDLFFTSLKDSRSPDFWTGIMQSDALRKSMRYQIETNLLKYIQRQYPKGVHSFSFLPKGIESGNVVLVNYSRNKYMCYYLPALNFSSLADVLSDFDINTVAEKYHCKWKL